MEFFHSKTFYNTDDVCCGKRDATRAGNTDYTMILILILMIFGDSDSKKGARD